MYGEQNHIFFSMIETPFSGINKSSNLQFKSKPEAITLILFANPPIGSNVITLTYFYKFYINIILMEVENKTTSILIFPFLVNLRFL